MNSDSRLIASIWTGVFITLIAAIFMMTGCQKEAQRLDAQLQAKCMSVGGNWAPARGSSESYVCDPR